MSRDTLVRTEERNGFEYGYYTGKKDGVEVPEFEVLHLRSFEEAEKAVKLGLENWTRILKDRENSAVIRLRGKAAGSRKSLTLSEITKKIASLSDEEHEEFMSLETELEKQAFIRQLLTTAIVAKQTANPNMNR